MLSLCNFLGVKEDEVFQFIGFIGKYRVHANLLQIRTQQCGNYEWQLCARPINDIAQSAVIKKKQLSEKDIEILKAIRLLYPEIKYISMDKSGSVWGFDKKPFKSIDLWDEIFGSVSYQLQITIDFISWEDDEPFCIDDYLSNVVN